MIFHPIGFIVKPAKTARRIAEDGKNPLFGFIFLLVFCAAYSLVALVYFLLVPLAWILVISAVALREVHRAHPSNAPSPFPRRRSPWRSSCTCSSDGRLARP